jgi:hypothetical protein
LVISLTAALMTLRNHNDPRVETSASPAPTSQVVVHFEILDLGLISYTDLQIDRSELLLLELLERLT